MCGICGFNWSDAALVRQSAQALSHRGPDGDGFYVDDDVSLGHRRLKIIDLSEKGRNPMTNEDGSLQLVFNGELYNFQALRADLERKGHRFSSQTDTEVILHAYEEKGTDCLADFDGMFAFALWDSNKKVLFLATDPAGIKPVCYYHQGGKFVFASEVKALFKAGVPAELDAGALASLLENLHVTGGRTLFQNVRILPQGCLLVYHVRTDRLEIRRYHSLPTELSVADEATLQAEVDAGLDASVRSSLVSDVPLCLALSGGVDSSLLAAYAVREKPDLKTLTVGFGSELDEFSYARKVAEALGTDHREIHLDFSSINAHLPEVVWHLESPPARTAVLPTYLVAKEARKHATVMLLGEGGDELYGGYERHLPFETGAYASEAPRLQESFFKRGGASAYFQDLPADSEPAVFSAYDQGSGEAVNSALRYDFANQLPGSQLLRVDRLTMAASLEARVPFLNRSVIDRAFCVPSALKVRNGVGKYLLKKIAVARGIPSGVVYRPKIGFQAPLNEWFESEFFELSRRILCERNVRDAGVLKDASVRRALSRSGWLQKLVPRLPGRPLSGLSSKARNVYAGRLWFLSMFVLWHQVFLQDGAVAPRKLDDYL